MLKTGMIGLGKTVRIAHAPALQALRQFYAVKAIADRSPEALELVGDLLGVPPEHRYTAYQEMLLFEELDVVDIALPHAFHRDAARAALLAGAHLITERPLSLTLAEAEELLRLAEQRGKQISVLHYFLYYSPFREAIRRMQDGAIGQPFFIRCEGVTGGYGPGTAAYHPDWHNDPAIAGGGVWMDNGYHGVYLCEALMGAPVLSVAAQIGTNTRELQVDDTAAVLLTHTQHTVSSVQVAWSVPSGGQRVLEIYGTEGTLALDHEGYALGIFSNASQSWSHPDVTIDRDGSFIGIFEDIAHCLLHGAPPPVSHHAALHTLEIVLAAYRASENGTVEGVGTV